MNTETSGSMGTQGTLNDRGVLFWGSQRRRRMEPISTEAIKITAVIAHHLACDKPCKPQISNALSPTKPIQLVTMAANANKAVLCDGCRACFTISSGESSSSGLLVCVFKLASSFFALTRPTVSGWYLRIKTHKATME